MYPSDVVIIGSVLTKPFQQSGPPHAFNMYISLMQLSVVTSPTQTTPTRYAL